MAELAIANGNLRDARQYLQDSEKEAPTVARTALLKGDLFYAENEDEKAREQWISVAASNPRLAEFSLDKMILSYQRCGQQDALKAYLSGLDFMPKDARIFERWKDTLNHLWGSDHALRYILSRVEYAPIGSAIASFLEEQLESKRFDESEMSGLLAQMLEHMRPQISDYQCLGCGFDTKAMYWFCPNCSEWESFR